MKCKNKCVSLSLQQLRLKNTQGIEVSSCSIKREVLRVQGKISSNWKIYTFTIEYRLYYQPQIRLFIPNLKDIVKKRNDKLPHNYGFDLEREFVTLCLFKGWGEFNSTMFIADTIIPWTKEWLHYFEIWSTGLPWCGGGHH